MPSNPSGPHGERRYSAPEDRFFVSRALLLALAVAVGCETSQLEPRDSSVVPPEVSGPFITPAGSSIDTVTPSGQTYLVTASVGVRATDPSGQASLASVRAEALRPGTASIATAANLRDDGIPPDTTAGDSVFSGLLTIPLRRDQAGIYRIRFQAQNTGALRSTTLELPFAITRSNTPPELDTASFNAPDTVTTPISGVSFFFMSIAASDADGLQDIREVFLQNLSSLNKDYLLDDGGTISGDLLAGDGIFSVTLQLPSTIPPGSYAFRLQAVDSFQDTSRSLPYTLVVRSP